MRASILSLVALDTMMGAANGFVPPLQRLSFQAHTGPSFSWHARRPSSGADEEASEFDVDQVRQSLEALLVGTTATADNTMARQQQEASPKTNAKSMLREKTLLLEEDPIDFDLDLPTQPPLTSIDRERRTAEIYLLSKLQDGDEGLSDLWTHWFQERGAAAAARLQQAEELTARGPRSYGEAETVLRGLIHDYGVYWVEPINRLATLYYMQGKLRESETLSKIVLKIKPWHFGALSGIVMVYAGLRDAESARMWAARRIPTFASQGTNKRRSAWVERAVQEAASSLEDAEKRLTQSFGEPDPRSWDSSSHDVLSNDAWQ